MLKRTLVSAAIVLVLAIVLVGGYVEHWAWTGYRNQKDHQPRTLWDWLGVSVLPLAVALTPAWLRTRGRLRREWRVAALLTATLLGLLALGGYLLHWTWTGFTGNTLYDWLQLFLVPCALPMAFALLDAKAPQTGVDDADQGMVDDADQGIVGPVPAVGRRGRWVSGAAACLIGLGAFVIGGVAALVTGGFGLAGASGSSSPPQTGETTRPPAQAPAAGQVARWLVVEGQDPWWTDTGIPVSAHERLDISAVGQVRPSPRPVYHWASPAGLRFPAPPGHLSIDKRIRHAALVATVGRPGQVLSLSQTPPSPVIDVGKRRTIIIPRRGELFLGLNDERTADNKGWFGVTITMRRGS